jgi:RNA polymerase sigma factor (sigma-70 family)
VSLLVEQISDKEIIELILLKDSTALELLYDRYERAMYHFAYRMVHDPMMAEEVVQELFLRIWNSAEKFNPIQGKLTTWMFTLTRNIAIDLLRKKRSRTPEGMSSLSENNYSETLQDEKSNTQTEVESKLVNEEVREALKELNSDQKQVVEWIYFKGLTHQEVSSTYDIPLGTVKSRVRLALKNLHQKLQSLTLRGGDE